MFYGHAMFVGNSHKEARCLSSPVYPLSRGSNSEKLTRFNISTDFDGVCWQIFLPNKQDTVRPVPNAAPLMCRTKLNTVRLWSDFGATADSDGVLASDLIREGHGKYFSMRKICDLNSLTLSK